MAKHAADRLQALVIGGAHPYADSAEAFRDVDGTDPGAFNDIQALAAAMHDRDSLEAVMPTMTMPSLLYVGEADPRFPKVQECVKSMPNTTFLSIPDLNHSQANMRSDLVLPHVIKFLSENS